MEDGAIRALGFCRVTQCCTDLCFGPVRGRLHEGTALPVNKKELTLKWDLKKWARYSGP